MVEAARRLFLRDGYASTTIQALAKEADVAVQTVYASFGSKREVLKELFDISVVGDNEQIPLIERPEWQAWETESDPWPAGRPLCPHTAAGEQSNRGSHAGSFGCCRV